MALVPDNITIQADDKFYGGAEMTLYDVQGQEVFTQTVHNRLLDAGENYLLQSAFSDGTSVIDNVSVGAICVTAAATLTDEETVTAADFDGASDLSTKNCEIGPATISSGIATIGPLTFEAATNDNNVPADTTITGVGICLRSANGDDFNNCATNGILFAQVDTTDVTIKSGETADVTYRFDIASAGN